jgi:hypothetical protein
MFVVEDENELTHDGASKWRMWGAAIDEAYGRNPYAQLNLKIGQDLWTHRVPLEDASIVAEMLRHVADSLDQIAVKGAARAQLRKVNT